MSGSGPGSSAGACPSGSCVRWGATGNVRGTFRRSCFAVENAAARWHPPIHSKWGARRREPSSEGRFATAHDRAEAGVATSNAHPLGVRISASWYGVHTGSQGEATSRQARMASAVFSSEGVADARTRRHWRVHVSRVGCRSRWEASSTSRRGEPRGNPRSGAVARRGSSIPWTGRLFSAPGERVRGEIART